MLTCAYSARLSLAAAAMVGLALPAHAQLELGTGETGRGSASEDGTTKRKMRSAKKRRAKKKRRGRASRFFGRFRSFVRSVLARPSGDAKAGGSKKARRTKARKTTLAKRSSSRTRVRLTLEPGLDRPGQDYRNYVDASAEGCRKTCAKEAQCKSFTWFRAGIWGNDPHCFLKSGTPSTRKAEGYISGLKVGARRVAAAAGRSSTMQVIENSAFTVKLPGDWKMVSLGSSDDGRKGFWAAVSPNGNAKAFFVIRDKDDQEFAKRWLSFIQTFLTTQVGFLTVESYKERKGPDNVVRGIGFAYGAAIRKNFPHVYKFAIAGQQNPASNRILFAAIGGTKDRWGAVAKVLKQILRSMTLRGAATAQARGGSTGGAGEAAAATVPQGSESEGRAP